MLTELDDQLNLLNDLHHDSCVIKLITATTSDMLHSHIKKYMNMN